MEKIKKKRKNTRDEIINEAAKESFPTSDPPAWTLGTNPEIASYLTSKEHTIVHMLAYEHDMIKKVINALSKLIETLQNNKQVDANLLNKLYEFLHRFADLDHQQKEEMLFSSFKRSKNKPSDYLLKDLKREHKMGKQLFADLAVKIRIYSEGNISIKDQLISTLKDIQYFYINHLNKEDEYILIKLNKLIAEDDQKKLLKKFAKIEEKLATSEETLITSANQITMGIEQ